MVTHPGGRASDLLYNAPMARGDPAGCDAQEGDRDAREASEPGADRAAGVAAVVLATTAFSWGFIIVKALPLPGPAVACWRLSIGAAVLTGVALALRTRWTRPTPAILLAGAAFAVHQFLYIAAARQTSIAIVTVVGATMPLLVTLASRRAVGEQVAPSLFAWAALALVGVGVIVGANVGDPSRSAFGDLLAVANVLLFTVYFLAAKKARVGGAATVTMTATILWIAAIPMLPLALATGRVTPGSFEIALIALLALGPGNGHLLVNWAHRRVRAALASLLLAGGPVLAATWAHLVLGEPLTWRHLLGMALVILAIEGGRRADGRTRVPL
jgi:drug/metabolite transporter (DMT)-like permease